MNYKISIIGGDARNVNLVKQLQNDGNIVKNVGLEQNELLKSNNITKAENIEKLYENTDIVIGPVPFTKDGKNIYAPFSNQEISIVEVIEKLKSQIFIAGSINQDVANILNDKKIQFYDIMKREELAVLNAIATAEGTIEIAINKTDRILHGSKVLILGFGRISKVLANKLKALSVDVTCAARKIEDKAWIKTYGYNYTNINDIGNNLKEYDIIINTVPQLILDKNRLNYVRKDCLLIDLASNPGGIDRETAKEMQIKLEWALALPGKVAPVTSAEFIKDTIYNILEEIK